MITAGMALFSTSPDDESGIDECRQFIRERGFTKDDVKIIKLHGSVLVITKKDIPDGTR